MLHYTGGFKDEGICCLLGRMEVGGSPEPLLKREASCSCERSFVWRPVCFDRPEREKDNRGARQYSDAFQQ